MPISPVPSSPAQKEKGASGHPDDTATLDLEADKLDSKVSDLQSLLGRLKSGEVKPRPAIDKLKKIIG